VPVAIAIARDQFFDTIGHLVGGVADAVLQPIGTIGDVILDVVGRVSCIVADLIELVMRVVVALGRDCLRHCGPP